MLSSAHEEHAPRRARDEGFQFRYPAGWEKPKALRAGGSTTVMVTVKGPVSGKVVSFARITASYSTKRTMNAESVERITARKKKKGYEVVKVLKIKGKDVPLLSKTRAEAKAGAGATFTFYYPSKDEFHGVSVQVQTDGIYSECLTAFNALAIEVAASFEWSPALDGRA